MLYAYHRVGNRQLLGSCCTAQGTQLGLGGDLEGGKRVGWQGGSRVRGYVCTELICFVL